MECDICSDEYSGRDDISCASCARSSVYLLRLDLARVLLENEQLNSEVSSIVSGTSAAQQSSPALVTAQQTWREEVEHAERTSVKARIDQTRTSMTALRDDLEQLKAEIKQRRDNNTARKKSLATISSIIPDRRKTSTETLSEMREKGTISSGSVSNRSANTRAFLCREAAALLRLRQKKRQLNGTVVEQFSITGLALLDLKEINNIRCTDLTASLTSTAHLLVLVAFYLGVRLPAEVTIPYRDYPLPTINTPAQSYLGQKISFPGSGSISTAPSSPFSSKHDVKGPYRPRPLFVGSDDREEKVAQFAKRDSTAFSFFVEGISLLAWDIAWLCRSQGFSQGTGSWEEICDIGRNLYQLVFGQPQSPALLRVLSSREAQKRQNQSSGTSTPSQDGNMLPFAKLGQASHLSAHAFLGQTSLNEQNRSWKHSKYNTISDSLKKLLVTEMNNAEWELLQQQEWDDGGEQFDEAVVIKARATDGREYDDARSIITTRVNAEDQAQQTVSDREQNKPKGTSGWTKVKSRTES